MTAYVSYRIGCLDSQEFRDHFTTLGGVVYNGMDRLVLSYNRGSVVKSRVKVGEVRVVV